LNCDVSDFLHLLEEEVIPENTVDFREIIPISTYTGEGIEELKACVRKEVVKMNQQYESVLSGKKFQESPVTVFTITSKPVQATRPGRSSLN